MPTQATWQKISAYCLIFISLVLFIFVIKTLASILIPFVFALFFTLLLDPLVVLLNNKFKVPRWVGIVLVLILVFGFIYTIGFLVILNINQFMEDSGDFTTKLRGVFYGLQAWVDNVLRSLSRGIHVDFGKMDIGESLKGMFGADAIGTSLLTASNFVVNFFMVILYWLFMMAGKPKLEEQLKASLKKRKVDYEGTMELVKDRIQSYLSTKTLINLGNATASTILLLAFDIQFAILLGFLIFVLNFIPSGGAVLGTALPIFFAIIQYDLTAPFFIFLVILMIIQLSDGYFFEPKFVGARLYLSPVFIIISILFWSYVWGITGAFLAVPISGIIKIIVSNIDQLKPVAVIIGNEDHIKKKDL